MVEMPADLDQTRIATSTNIKEQEASPPCKTSSRILRFLTELKANLFTLVYHQRSSRNRRSWDSLRSRLAICLPKPKTRRSLTATFAWMLAKRVTSRLCCLASTPSTESASLAGSKIIASVPCVAQMFYPTPNIKLLKVKRTIVSKDTLSMVEDLVSSSRNNSRETNKGCLSHSFRDSCDTHKRSSTQIRLAYQRKVSGFQTIGNRPFFEESRVKLTPPIYN